METKAKALEPGDPARAKTSLDAWIAANPPPKATLAQVADHIDRVRKIAGIDHVGLGSDFDGIPATPEGLSGVDTYPALLAELARRGWSAEDLAKLAGGNVLRVMRAGEAVAARGGK
jgi:membrane dipeptidase